MAPQARKLKLYIGDIRKNYQRDWDSSDVRRRQMGVALYFIDKLALRAGHEKDEDEADTVGCCTLKVGLGGGEMRRCWAGRAAGVGAGSGIMPHDVVGMAAVAAGGVEATVQLSDASARLF